MFKFNNIKTPEQNDGHRSGVFIVNFERVSQLLLVFLLMSLQMLAGQIKLLLVSFAMLMTFYK